MALEEGESAPSREDNLVGVGGAIRGFVFECHCRAAEGGACGGGEVVISVNTGKGEEVGGSQGRVGGESVIVERGKSTVGGGPGDSTCEVCGCAAVFHGKFAVCVECGATEGCEVTENFLVEIGFQLQGGLAMGGGVVHGDHRTVMHQDRIAAIDSPEVCQAAEDTVELLGFYAGSYFTEGGILEAQARFGGVSAFGGFNVRNGNDAGG